jgi:hypothetical protein
MEKRCKVGDKSGEGNNKNIFYILNPNDSLHRKYDCGQKYKPHSPFKIKQNENKISKIICLATQM